MVLPGSERRLGPAAAQLPTNGLARYPLTGSGSWCPVKSAAVRRIHPWPPTPSPGRPCSAPASGPACGLSKPTGTCPRAKASAGSSASPPVARYKKVADLGSNPVGGASGASTTNWILLKPPCGTGTPGQTVAEACGGVEARGVGACRQGWSSSSAGQCPFDGFPVALEADAGALPVCGEVGLAAPGRRRGNALIRARPALPGARTDLLIVFRARGSG